ncbi:MAG: ABC transporter substrate-binding protein [Desulfotignum sp.]|nr:ABC transporter substrate-binding protein [Desulfotignum sp.]
MNLPVCFQKPFHPAGSCPVAASLSDFCRFPLIFSALVFPAIVCLVSFLPPLFPVSAHAAPGPVQVTDAAGRTLILEKPATRIVVVGSAPFIPLHMLYMFEEARDRLTGFEVRVQTTDAFLDLIDPDLSLKKTVNANPGPESVAALAPDLVISKSTTEGQMARSLAYLGIPVMYVGAETPDMFLADIRNMGTVLGNEKRADTIVRFYEDRLAVMLKAVSQIPEQSRPRVLVLEYSNRGNKQALNVPAPGWIQTRQAVLSGGNPVWTAGIPVRDGWQITGFEQIAAWDPDKIFLIVWYQLTGPAVLKTLYQDPKWAKLTAVKKKELHLFPQDIFGWDSASPRWILGALWMAKKTYPKKFETLDMSRTVMEFFTLLYGLDRETIAGHLMPDVN